MLKKINYFCIRNTVLKGLLLYWYASVLVSKSSALIDRSLLGSQCKEKLTACLMNPTDEQWIRHLSLNPSSWRSHPHFATPLLISSQSVIWAMSTEISYWCHHSSISEVEVTAGFGLIWDAILSKYYFNPAVTFAFLFDW